jgi:hypothetical protein
LRKAFYVIIKSGDSTTNITLSPTTSTIDGLTSITIGPKESVLVYCDGSNYRTLSNYLTVWKNRTANFGSLRTIGAGSAATPELSGDFHNGIMVRAAGGTVTTSGAGSRMFWDPTTLSFRAGSVSSTQWDPANLGGSSLAFGTNNKVTTLYSTVLNGDGNTINCSTITSGSTILNSNSSTITGVGSGNAILNSPTGSTMTACAKTVVVNAQDSHSLTSCIGVTVLDGDSWVANSVNRSVLWSGTTGTHTAGLTGAAIFIPDAAAGFGINTLAPKAMLHTVGNNVIGINGEVADGNMDNNSECNYLDGSGNLILKTKNNSGTIKKYQIADVVGKHAWELPMGSFYSSMTLGATVGQVETNPNKCNYRGWSFSFSGNNYVHFRTMMPKSWNQGTVTFILSWASTGGAGNVVWSIQGVSRVNGNAQDLAFGTAITLTSAASANNAVITAESSAMTFAGTLTYPCEVEIRINRNGGSGSDTFTANAILIGVQMFITTNAGTDA